MKRNHTKGADDSQAVNINNWEKSNRQYFLLTNYHQMIIANTYE